MSDKKKQEAKRTKLKKLGVKIIIVLVLIAAILVSVYYYLQYQEAQKRLNNPTLVASEETRSLVQEISKIIELPQGEDPEVATVSDKKQLPAQPFFANAENGDKVLIYQNAGKVFLYRPGENKIIEVSYFSNIAEASASETTASDSASQQASEATRVAIYNGTTTSGLAASYASELTEAIPNIEVVSKLDAVNSYSANLVIDLSGENAEMATQIASVVEGELGALPEGEARPNADILVIAGK